MNNLFIGSSIIERWNNLPFPNSINLGISGLTTNLLQKKYSLVLSKYPNTQSIFLYIGSNDIVYKHNIQYTFQNIIEFILYLNRQNKNIHIFFIAILKSPNRTKIQKTQIDYLNRKMREFISPNFHFINCNRQLNSNENYLSDDQTHLSSIGYNKLNQCLSSCYS